MNSSTDNPDSPCDLYKRLYDHLPLMTVVVRSDATIVSCNRQFAVYHNKQAVEIEGRKFGEFLQPEDRVLFDRFLVSMTGKEPHPRQQVIRFITADNTDSIKIRIFAVSVDDCQKDTAVLMVMEDVTTQIDLEDERRTARKQLYRSSHLASIGTLASGVAHELNNPLTAILGFSSALISRIDASEEIDRKDLESYLKIIYQETIRCRDIVDHLHRFARDTGEVRIDRVSLHDCVKNALRLVRPKAARAGIAIVHQIPTDVCVLADANKLEQVFINLLTNCIEFCRNGASVTITESPEKRGPRFFRLLVSDNGPGMPPAVLAKVFDPFFTTKEVGKGIGLGLAMCHRIMEELNGHIDIVSEKGAGTTVLLEIPYAL